MKKLIIAYLFTITNVFAAPPTYFNGELQTNTYIQNIKAPNYQTTPLGGIDRRLETGNLNELQNPNFEHSTVSTGWTVSNATASGNTANPLEGKKSISLALTGALSLSQSSTINAAQKSGVQMVASIWVNSSDVSDLQLCSLKNGAEDKCTVSGGYVQGSGWRQLTVSFLGDSTSNGLKLKSTDTTGTVLVDQAFVGIGSPVVDFTPDMVYSAIIETGTGVVANENTDWIDGNCTTADSPVCTFKAGIFTQAPNCTTAPYQSNVFARIESLSSASITLSSRNTGGSHVTSSVYLICQKQGADYKTSKAYVASTSTQGLEAGTIIPTSAASCPAGTLPADGSPVSRTTYSELFAKIGVTHGQGDGSTTFNIPDYRGRFLRGVNGTAGNDPDKDSRTAMNTGGNTGNAVGSVQSDQYASHNHNLNLFGGSPAGVGVYLGVSGLTYNTTSNLGTQGAIGNTGGNETRPKNAYVNYCIRTTSQATIVGSFQGYNETPGTSRVETFSVSYGTTNATTICSASPCSYLDQIGNAVTSIARSGTGTYSLNTSKTYSKLKCALNALNPSGTGAVPYGSSSYNVSCANCSSLLFASISPSTGGYTDSFGTFVCQGIPQ